MADPLLKYHPFPSPERHSKEQRVINFKQKGHLNIQKEENNSSINYKAGRAGFQGEFVCVEFVSAQFISLSGGSEEQQQLREDGWTRGKREVSSTPSPTWAQTSGRTKTTSFWTRKREVCAWSCSVVTNNKQRREGCVLCAKGGLAEISFSTLVGPKCLPCVQGMGCSRMFCNSFDPSPVGMELRAVGQRALHLFQCLKGPRTSQQSGLVFNSAHEEQVHGRICALPRCRFCKCWPRSISPYGEHEV